MTDIYMEKARVIIDKFLKRPDWIDTGYDDCFVCGTPLKIEKYIQRSQAIVEEIAQALNQAVLAERAACAEVAERMSYAAGATATSATRLIEYELGKEITEAIRARGEK